MNLTLVLTASLILAGTPDQVSRRAPTAGQKATVQATIALRAGRQAYDFSGQAQCRHAPQASIYDINAEMWSVEQNEAGKRLNMTVWKPKDGSQAMLNLTLSTGGKEARVSTVKAPKQAASTGSGTVTFAAEGKGGTFTINASTQSGEKVSGTVKCDAFTPLVAEGGNE